MRGYAHSPRLIFRFGEFRGQLAGEYHPRPIPEHDHDRAKQIHDRRGGDRRSNPPHVLAQQASRGIAKLSPMPSGGAPSRNGLSCSSQASAKPSAETTAAARNTGRSAAMTAVM